MAECVRLTKYKCPGCHQLRDTEEEADKHCICKCGQPVKPRDPRMGHFDQCAVCDMRAAVVRAKARLRKQEEEIADSRDHLVKLEALFEAEKAAAKPAPTRRAS